MTEALHAVGAWLYALVTHKVSLVALGGAVGTLARYQLSVWIGLPAWSRGFPVATFLINVTGSFILGIAAGVIGERLPPAYGYWYLLVGTGFCGGYTTFSTFEYETYRLVDARSYGLALTYVGASVVAGFLGVVLAVQLLHALFPKG